MWDRKHETHLFWGGKTLYLKDVCNSSGNSGGNSSGGNSSVINWPLLQSTLDSLKENLTNPDTALSSVLAPLIKSATVAIKLHIQPQNLNVNEAGKSILMHKF